MYAQTCTQVDISFAIGILSGFQSNPSLYQWKVAKKVKQYLQGIKDYMLAYKHSDHLDVIGYLVSDFMGCQDSMISTSGYIFMLVGGAILWKSKQSIIEPSTMS
jgi:hypothetical protein